jgi:predicted cation transporter
MFMGNIPAEPVLSITIGLALITLLVLVLPFLVRFIEHNLELFFLVMGVLAVTISGLWSPELLLEAFRSPVTIGSLPLGIFQVVLIFGVLLYYFHEKFYRLISRIAGKFSLRIFIFMMVVILGLISSIISVIVTAVLLAEIVTALPLDKTSRIRLVVITCFAVGLGAVLTPLGEPLSTILVQKLSGTPYYAGFTFPAVHFALYVIPGVITCAILAAIWVGNKGLSSEKNTQVESPSRLRDVIIRAIKVFVFVAALVLLGEGLKPLIVWYIVKIPAFGLYWINILSAVMDNATLTAVEITTTMTISQIVSITMALLVSGGMLIPGNIPNIVSAGRLKISMKEWARIGIPIGMVLMVIYFLALLPIIFD